ncbi:MAG: GNAT family N-acetyltransferase [Planctomycetaceae bacterium]
MKKRPCLESARLLLRPFDIDDAADVRELAGHRDVASTTLLVPHPYEDGMAEQWISTHQERFDRRELSVFAIIRRSEQSLIGAIDLTIESDHQRAALGYWIGRPHWGHGYCTEAAQLVLRYGFGDLGLNRIAAQHLSRNPASGRVLEKAGMQHEGRLRRHVKKWGVFEDVECYAVLKSEFQP